MAEITTPNYIIRFATEQDVTEILRMVQELASYERSLHEVLATEEKLLETLSFPSNPSKGFAKTILVTPTKSPGSIAGMALYFNNYSTWTAAPGIYLEDLFVRPAFRKHGFGKALLQALARECVHTGCQRLDWSVLNWNQPSIDFYESETIGAKKMSEWTGMRVDGENLARLASRDP